VRRVCVMLLSLYYAFVCVNGDVAGFSKSIQYTCRGGTRKSYFLFI
jgi:hypothetical protein